MRFFYLAVTFLILFSLHTACDTDKTEEPDADYSTPDAIADGKKLPKFTITVTSYIKEKQYLGLKEDLVTFSVSKVPAKIIVFEIFSINCPYCKMQATKLSNVYKLIQHNDKIAKDVKVIGVAVGCNRTDLEKWKAFMHVPFPLFPDENSIVWRQLGKPGVPTTLLIDSKGKVLTSYFGVTKDEEDLFCQIKEFCKQQ